MEFIGVISHLLTIDPNLLGHPRSSFVLGRLLSRVRHLGNGFIIRLFFLGGNQKAPRFSLFLVNFAKEFRLIFCWKRANDPIQRSEKYISNLKSWCVTVPFSRWWFQIFFIFTSIWGRRSHFDDHIFQMGWNHQLVFLLGLLAYLP